MVLLRNCVPKPLLIIIPHHNPEADGLAKRVVQTVKQGLRKYGLCRGNHRNWDLISPWIAMGYRFNIQASWLCVLLTNFCMKETYIAKFYSKKLNLVVDLNDPEVWAKCLHERAEFFK